MEFARQEIGLVVLPRASMLAAGAIVDAFAIANNALGDECYRLRVLDNGTARQPLAPDTPLRGAPRLDALFVVCDAPLPESGHDELVEAIREQARLGALVAGVGTGVWLLARAGLLRGQRATIDWPYVPVFAQRFADIVVCGQLFEIGDFRLSCAGGVAVIDALAAWLGARHGDELGQAIQLGFGTERLRAGDEHQRVPLSARIGGGQPKLAEAVSLMEANLAEPLGSEDIAQLVGVSRRQLERLFKQHLDALPSRYYLEMRLQHARRMLLQTGQSILQVGLSCGFSSGPHFSSAYRSRFGITPREQRSGRAAQLAAAAPPPEVLSDESESE